MNLVLERSRFVIVVLIVVLELLRGFALVEELTILELVWTEEPLLAVEGLPLEDTAVVADVVVVLVEHVAGSDPVYALLALLNGQRLVQVLVEDEHFVALGHLLELISIELSCLCKVPSRYWLILQAVELQELQELLIATVPEHPLLRIRYVVHLEAPYE